MHIIPQIGVVFKAIKSQSSPNLGRGKTIFVCVVSGIKIVINNCAFEMNSEKRKLFWGLYNRNHKNS